MPVELTPGLWADLERVHREVLDVFKWQEDRVTWGVVERWDRPIPAADGHLYEDCDGFALECLFRLAALGWPVDCLRLAVCRTEAADPARPGYDHAVLCVETTEGVYVLDCRRKWVEPITALPYSQWAAQQAGRSIALPWESLEISRD